MGDNFTIEGEVLSYVTYFGDMFSFKVKKACEREHQSIDCNIIYNAAHQQKYGSYVIPNADIAGLGVRLHLPTGRTLTD
jgi:hypothetical protein